MTTFNDTMSESELQEGIVTTAGLSGWMVYHTYNSQRSAPGFPDLVLVHADRGMVIAELKSAKGKPTTDQWAWLTMLARWNAHVYLWRPCDYDAVLAWLTGQGEAPEAGRVTAPVD